MTYDHLLLWMSAVGSGTWDRFRKCIDELCLSTTARGADDESKSGFSFHHKVRLAFERLGHAEFFRNDEDWRIVPPTLALLPNTRNVGVLCGARPEQIVQRIKLHRSKPKVDFAEQDGPRLIRIETSTPEQLRELADDSQLYYSEDSSLGILAGLPPVDNLQFRQPVELPFGTDWKVHEFSPDLLKWIESSPASARRAVRGLFRFMVHNQPQYYIIVKREAYSVPNQVGKYIALRQQRCKVVEYDFSDHVFSVPPICRPPSLIDRALTLCDGMLPGFVNGRLAYNNVPPSIAIGAAKLIRQSA